MEVLGEVKNASQAVSEAVKAIPEVKIPDHTPEYKKWKNEILKALEIEIPEVDLGPVIKAIEKIKFPEVKIPIPYDYTKLLKEIKSSLPETADLTKIEKLLSNIEPFEIPAKLLTKDGSRIKVEVDRISYGGGGGGSISVEELNFQNYDDTTTANVIYIGNSNGTKWEIQKFDSSAKSMRYARGSADYAGSWNNRTSLIYLY